MRPRARRVRDILKGQLAALQHGSRAHCTGRVAVAESIRRALAGGPNERLPVLKLGGRPPAAMPASMVTSGIRIDTRSPRASSWPGRTCSRSRSSAVKTASMVSRYAHRAPGHLAAAVERLVVLSSKDNGAVELARNYPAPLGSTKTTLLRW